MSKAHLLVALLMALLAAACGGGGGGTPAIGASTFAGPYEVFGFAAASGPVEITAQFGSITADGVATMSGLLDRNRNAVFSTGYGNDFEYTVGANGALDWQFGLKGTVYSGGLSADGAVGLVGTVFTGSLPAFQLLARRGAGYSTASLNAVYHSVMQSVSGTALSSSFGQMDFQGNGVLQRTVTVSNVGGTVSTLGSWLAPGSYSINPAGSFVADLGFGLATTGQVLPGTDVILLAGATVSGQNPLLMAMIRTTVGASDATFAGSYWAISLRGEGAGFQGEVATVEADGAGNGSISGRENNGTSVTPFAPRSFTYSVLPDGQLDLVGGTAAFRGAVSADGRFAMLGGSVTSGEAPTFYFMMRK